MPDKILIIDDEKNLRQTTAMILKRAGYEVATAGNVDEARQLLQGAAYDLAFLDLKMPGFSGLEYLPELRREYPQMLVLVLTAHDRRESVLEAISSGARDFLLKPIEPAALITRVQDVLAERSQPQAARKLDPRIRGLFSGPEANSDPDSPPEGWDGSSH
jgi:DNA-binding response OmpR family regulator